MNPSFISLLAALFVLIFAMPLVGTATDAHPLREVLLVGVLMAGVFVATHNQRSLRTGVVLGVLALLSRGLPVFIENSAIGVFSNLMSIVFLLFVAWSMLTALAREKRVDLDTVAGGICIYLLIGLICSLGFGAISIVDAAAFAYSNGQVLSGLPDTLYFSFVTLTTLGYGDITPVAPMARSLAMIESIIGQLFIAVFIARLVALYTSQQESE